MAELVLKIGTVKKGHPEFYEDGDIVEAFTNKRIESAHVQNLCRTHRTDMKGKYRPDDCVTRALNEATMQYRFEQVSPHIVKRINLKTKEEDEITNVPNDKGEYMDVALYVSRRLKLPQHQMYGKHGEAVWYGGKQDFLSLSKVWSRLEEGTDILRTDDKYKLWMLSHTELCHFLSVPTKDFDNTKMGELISPKVEIEEVNGEEQEKILQKRHNDVDYNTSLDMSSDSLALIPDKNKPVKQTLKYEYKLDELVQVKE